jgi:hypothetical protein
MRITASILSQQAEFGIIESFQISFVLSYRFPIFSTQRNSRLLGKERFNLSLVPLTLT